MINATRNPDMTFVIGAGRSGTTLLYKLLCLHPHVAYLSNIEQRIPWLPLEYAGRVRLKRYADKVNYWFLAGGNAYTAQRPLLSRMIPTPVEGERFYRRHGMPAFPATETGLAEPVSLPAAFLKLQQAAQKKLFVSKRTANNRRLQTLDAIFPQAKYLHLIRDGRDVAASLSRVEWWNDHPLWWDPYHRTPRQALAYGVDMLWLCAHNWVKETEVIEHGLAQINSSQQLDVRFEDLVTSPIAEMQRLLDFLGLPQSVEFEDAISSLALGLRPPIWRQAWNGKEIAMVNREQASQLASQGYAL